MRSLLLAFLFFSTTSAFAQSDPAEPQKTPFTAWQLEEYAAYTQKCFLRQREPMQHRLELSVTIGPDGMIIGDPEVVAPIDSDEFREDVRTAIKKLHQCQPFIVDPFGRVRVQFTQVFKFRAGPEDPGESMIAAIHANFRNCWTAARTGPTIWVNLSYKPDGTYASPPLLINPEKTAEYSRAAAQVMRQITKCPPVKFPKDKYPDPEQSLRWQFPSHEGARVSGSKPPADASDPGSDRRSRPRQGSRHGLSRTHDRV
ncbi:hypothetical protein [Bradyrhizobium sp.]|jgi:hypothetical protein|uniref:hypothetical protein n=1 Tax=Bradyrhizobium sp. TaxID=376 RepID=UPI003C23C043